MKVLKALACLAVLGGFGWLAYQVRVAGMDVPGLPAFGDRTDTVAKGTELKLLLLTGLSSGGSKVGDQVKFVVAEPLTGASGRELVKEGEIVLGKVTASRGGTVAGALTNRPARLSVSLGKVKTVDGKSVQLIGNKENGSYEFSQANTKETGGLNVVDATQDSEAQAYVSSLFERMSKGEKLSDAERKEADKELERLIEKYDLKQAKGLIGKDGAKGATAILEAVKSGDVSLLAGIDGKLAVGALEEVGSLFSGIDKSLKGVVKGSNICARVGTKLTARTAVSVKIQTKS